VVPQQVRRSRRMSGVADIRSVVPCLGIRTRSDQSVTSGAFQSLVHVRTEFRKVVRSGGSQRGSQATHGALHQAAEPVWRGPGRALGR
jgi:hypothetical protein